MLKWSECVAKNNTSVRWSATTWIERIIGSNFEMDLTFFDIKTTYNWNLTDF